MNIMSIFKDIGEWITKDAANAAIAIAMFLFLLAILIFGI